MVSLSPLSPSGPPRPGPSHTLLLSVSTGYAWMHTRSTSEAPGRPFLPGPSPALHLALRCHVAVLSSTWASFSVLLSPVPSAHFSGALAGRFLSARLTHVSSGLHASGAFFRQAHHRHEATPSIRPSVLPPIWSLGMLTSSLGQDGVGQVSPLRSDPFPFVCSRNGVWDVGKRLASHRSVAR